MSEAAIGGRVTAVDPGGAVRVEMAGPVWRPLEIERRPDVTPADEPWTLREPVLGGRCYVVNGLDTYGFDDAVTARRFQRLMNAASAEGPGPLRESELLAQPSLWPEPEPRDGADSRGSGAAVLWIFAMSVMWVALAVVGGLVLAAALRHGVQAGGSVRAALQDLAARLRF